MHDILTELSREELMIFGGVLASILLQIIKRYIWQPPSYKKVQKIAAVVVGTFLVAFAAGYSGYGELLGNWIGMLMSAIGYHELTDKLGLKSIWKETVAEITYGERDTI